MAINKNHEFEELNGVKCAIVEKNISRQRMEFLKSLLEYNKFEVIVVNVTPPSAPATAATPESSNEPDTNEPVPVAPELFTLGVTDVSFNPVNAIFGRLLRTPDRHVVSLAYWQQKEKISDDQTPYFENKK